MKIKDIETALNEKVETKALELAQEHARKLMVLKARLNAEILEAQKKVKDMDKAIVDIDTDDFKMKALEIVNRPTIVSMGHFRW